MARRRRKLLEPSHSGSERWLITYADLITLLMIFFVVMYAMSKLDSARYETLSVALQSQFSDGSSWIPKGSGVTGDEIPGKLVAERGPSSAEPMATISESEKNPAQTLEQSDREENLQNLLKVVRQYISDRQLEDKVSASDTSRGIAITLNDLFLFDLGKADLKREAYPVLETLANLFPKLDAKVSIEGHTDDLPLNPSSLYQDNWGLSQARSVSVLRYFVQSTALPKDMFISAAYADTAPVAPNDTEENRRKNRRVEIVVLRGSERLAQD